ncbi:MAG: CoA transferase, partial [Devosiaceae bacterium]
MAMPGMEALAEAFEDDCFLAFDAERDGWERRDELFAMVREALPDKSSAAWMEIFEPLNIWAAPVYGYADLVSDPQIAHNGTFVEYDHPTEGRVKTPGFPIRFSKTPSSVHRGAPLAGEHSRVVLLDAGFSHQEINAMIAQGSVVSLDLDG